MEFLKEELSGKRFLLVLDDVAGVDDIQWRYLMEVLKPAARRSLIMATTRSQTAAAAIGTMSTVNLGPLPFDDYKKMLNHFASGGGADESEDCTRLGDEWDDADDPEELSPAAQTASELAKRMGGLPLPARALGRALYFRPDDDDHWRSVLEDKTWERRRRDLAEISPALWLSYQHLDPRLKLCFAYCAVFPNECFFRKEELVQMWMVQGLIYSGEASAAARSEDIGGKFFDELVEWCFLQIIGSNRYVVQNSMQALAQAVSTGHFFMVTDRSGEVPQEVRHLTITTDNLVKLKISGCSNVSADQEHEIKPLDWLNSLFNVHTLRLDNTLFLKLGMFDRLQSLESLEIDGSRGFFEDASDLEWLLKLQTLSVSNCKELCGIPENPCTLTALEELCIDNCPSIQALPANGLPTSLKRLSMSKCSPRLAQRCLDDELDWLKIAKISVVYIDGQCIVT